MQPGHRSTSLVCPDQNHAKPSRERSWRRHTASQMWGWFISFGYTTTDNRRVIEWAGLPKGTHRERVGDALQFVGVADRRGVR